MDFKAPIDITAVLGAVKKHKNLLQGVDVLSANEVLKHFTPIPGITDSIELGKVEGGSVSGKYIGKFEAGKNLGKIVPRRLVVRPVVMEVSDEPERYRRTYIAEVPGALRTNHPFEIWLINHGHELASNDLLNAMFIAKYSVQEEKKNIEDAFDGLGEIVNQGIRIGDIAKTEGNLFETGELTRVNVGDKLLEMFNSMPETFKRKRNIKMFVSGKVGEMYDQWRKDEGVVIIGMTEETAGTEYLLGTRKRCELVRLPNLPDNSQFVMLTTKENVCYGFDKESDFRSIRPFMSGNPYLFTAAGKYLIGFQFVSVHKAEFCVNDRPVNPEGDNPLGYVQVTITPDEAVANGAKWRIKDSDEWHHSGEMAARIPGSNYDIEYSEAAGYTKAEDKKITITKGQVLKETGTYNKAD